MKNFILLLAMCLLAKSGFAHTVHSSIDKDLDFKLESDAKESERGLAAFNEEEIEKNKTEVETEANEKLDENGEEKDRELASDTEVFDSTNENGIRYWKYDDNKANDSDSDNSENEL